MQTQAPKTYHSHNGGKRAAPGKMPGHLVYQRKRSGFVKSQYGWAEEYLAKQMQEPTEEQSNEPAR